MTTQPNPGESGYHVTENAEYQKFVESMVPLCRCARDCPCDGVLAGGICDNIQDDPDDERDEE